MADLIAKFGNLLADTPEGQSWVIKALHPADPITDTRGIPDESSSPSVIFQYNTVARISAPAGSVGTWEFDMTVIPDAIVHAVYSSRGRDSGGSNLQDVLGIMNSALRSPGNANTTYLERFTNFKDQGVEAHRLCYMSVTAYQDGPALANQGTVCASQYEVAGRTYAVGEAGASTNVTAYLPLIRFQDSDLALYETSQTMPNAYFSESKYGCYMPLKLGRPSHRWMTDERLVKHGPNGTWTAISGSSSWDGIERPVTATAPPGQAPYPDVVPAWFKPTDTRCYGDAMFPPLNDIWGGISCRGLSVDSTYSLFFRVGIECRVQPGTLMAPQQRMSPPFDPKAIQSYFKINRELKDAYPADYNDLGKIWEVIKGAAESVLPLLHPSLGPVVNLIKGIKNPSRKGRGQRESLPAAQVQRVRDSLAASGPLTFSRTRAPRVMPERRQRPIRKGDKRGG